MQLNLGCGLNKRQGFVNVDKYAHAQPDVLWDLESTPWPWSNNSIHAVLFDHSLEHMGAQSTVFLGIMQELYRICKPDARIHINAPHPRHDDFICDPTHVRIITPQMFWLFSREANLNWQAKGAANTPLALYLGVDFVLEHTKLILEEPYATQLRDNRITNTELESLVRERNNVVREMHLVLRVVKPG